MYAIFASKFAHDHWITHCYLSLSGLFSPKPPVLKVARFPAGQRAMFWMLPLLWSFMDWPNSFWQAWRKAMEPKAGA